MQRIEEIRWQLELAIDKAKADGYIVAVGTFKDGKCLCPLTTLNPKKISDAKSAAEYLGVSERWINSFTNAVDGSGAANGEPEAFQLGQYFRLKYNFPMYFDIYQGD